MKGIFNLRLALPRQFAVWDPDIVYDYLSNLEHDLPLKDLSEKLVILLCLLFGQRDQTVKALNIKGMLLEKSKCGYVLYQEASENHKITFSSVSYCILRIPFK